MTEEFICLMTERVHDWYTENWESEGLEVWKTLGFKDPLYSFIRSCQCSSRFSSSLPRFLWHQFIFSTFQFYRKCSSCPTCHLTTIRLWIRFLFLYITVHLRSLLSMNRCSRLRRHWIHSYLMNLIVHAKSLHRNLSLEEHFLML